MPCTGLAELHTTAKCLTWLPKRVLHGFEAVHGREGSRLHDWSYVSAHSVACPSGMAPQHCSAGGAHLLLMLGRAWSRADMWAK